MTKCTTVVRVDSAQYRNPEDVDAYVVRLRDRVEHVEAISIISADIPFNAYTVREGINDRVPFRLGSDDLLRVAIIPEGYYLEREDALALELERALNRASDDVEEDMFRVVYEERRGGYVIDGKRTHSFHWRDEEGGTDYWGKPTVEYVRACAARLLGFGREDTASSPTGEDAQPPAATSTHTDRTRSTFCGDPKYYSHHIEMRLSTGRKDAISTSTQTNRDVFAVFSRTSSDTVTLKGSCVTLNPPVTIDRLVVSFHDREGNAYEFQNREHVFELAFTTTTK